MSQAAGEQLRAAREQKGLSVDDVAARLKVPARYVQAIENGDLAALPEPTFVRGYVKAYAKTVGLDADALVALLAPVEVKAPKQLVGLDNAGGAVSTRRPPRTPKFRSGLRKHHWIAGGVLAVVAVTWTVWSGREDAVPVVVGQPAVSAVEQPLPAPVPQAGNGGVTLDVPLPGAPSAQQPAAPVAGTVPAPAAVGTPAGAAAPGTPAAAAVPAVASAPLPVVTPATKGLYVKFRGTSWVEVRDVDNVVIHTSIAMPDSELALDGKPPLSVTLGDTAVAELFYNGTRVPLDKYARSGVARIIVGQAAR